MFKIPSVPVKIAGFGCVQLQLNLNKLVFLISYLLREKVLLD